MTGPGGSKRVALFFYEIHIGAAPSVISAASELLRRGHDVHLFHMKPPFRMPPPDLPDGIHRVEISPWSRRLTFALKRRLWPRQPEKTPAAAAPTGPPPAGNPLVYWLREFIMLAHIFEFAMLCRLRSRRFDLAIPFDMTGLAVMNWALPRRTPFIYWSLEILLLAEAQRPAFRFLKRLEMRRIPEARAIVVQGRERRELLARDIAFRDELIVIVPNGPPAPPDENLPRDFFYRRFNIAPSTKIVLHAGMIEPVVGSEELAAAAAPWPHNFALIFHSSEKRSPDEPYLRAVQQAGGKRVILSLEPVALEMVDRVYAGAHIGLIFYKPINANYATTWESSGKLVYYLRNGLPVVIVADSPTSKLDEWGCGIWVRDFAGISAAIQTIIADYGRFSANARRCYDENFDFRKAFDRLMTVAERGAA
jgi:hypothetical protein